MLDYRFAIRRIERASTPMDYYPHAEDHEREDQDERVQPLTPQTLLTPRETAL